MNRVLAALAAIGLVAGAVLVRHQVDGGGSATSDIPLTVVCGTDLAPACERLGGQLGDAAKVTVEPEATTAQRLASGQLKLGRDTVWLAAGPWPEVTAAGGTAMPALAASDVLASSPAVIVARTDRMSAITSACPEAKATWACIGGQAGQPWTQLGGQAAWGRVEVGLPVPDSGAGLVAVDQAVASKVGRSDFAINDIDDDPDTAAWFDQLAAASNANVTGTTPLAHFLQVPGSLGVVGALESEAGPALRRAASGRTLQMVVPEPVAQAQVRLWGADRAATNDAVDRLGGRGDIATALAGTGWRVPDRSRPDGAANMDMPADAGLPSPGVSSAVRTRWENAR